MGLWDWLKGSDEGRGVDELARRLGVSVAELAGVKVTYRRFSIPKRSGGGRAIDAPAAELKAMQRRIQRRLLARLPRHACATGFVKGYSIVSNAAHHAGQAVIVHMDLKDFFASTRSARIEQYFKAIGWNRAATKELVRLCTWAGALPQGASTSPALSNLVNYRLDVRLATMAERVGARYSRYADDLTFSFELDDRRALHELVRGVKAVVAAEGYTLHQRRKFHVRRSHQQQRVTGLVVNNGVNLPRLTRRRLRAIEHRLRTGRPATLSAAQVAGWRALQNMVETQRP